jgi:hypothetical protein
MLLISRDHCLRCQMRKSAVCHDPLLCPWCENIPSNELEFEWLMYTFFTTFAFCDRTWQLYPRNPRQVIWRFVYICGARNVFDQSSSLLARHSSWALFHMCTHWGRSNEHLWFICVHDSIVANIIEHILIKWPRNVYFTSIPTEDVRVAEFYLFVECLLVNPPPMCLRHPPANTTCQSTFWLPYSMKIFRGSQ